MANTPHPQVHECNRHLLPELDYADYPTTQGTYNDSLIVSRYITRVLHGMSIEEARRTLWSYTSPWVKLAAFDSWLVEILTQCGDRPAQLKP